MRPIVPVLCLAIAGACSAPVPDPPLDLRGHTIVDLSHSFDETTIVWPTSDVFRLETVSEGMTPAGYYYAANNFFSAEHGGTHIDAPIHFSEGRWTVDEIPVERLVGPAIVIDVAASAEADPDYQITAEDLQRAEEEDGEIPPGALVLLRTGFSARWPDAARYLGTAERGADAVAELHFPGLHPDAARWLVGSRQISAIGIDTASIDYGQSTQYESHRVLFARDIPAFENLTALERLPRRGASVIALPMKIGRGSGAPLRAIALLPATAP